MGEYQNIYIGKIGADNFALMLIGALFAAHYYFDRQPLFCCCAIYFLTYGFLFDLYRIKFFRSYLLFNLNQKRRKPSPACGVCAFYGVLRGFFAPRPSI